MGCCKIPGLRLRYYNFVPDNVENCVIPDPTVDEYICNIVSALFLHEQNSLIRLFGFGMIIY